MFCLSVLEIMESVRDLNEKSAMSSEVNFQCLDTSAEFVYLPLQNVNDFIGAQLAYCRTGSVCRVDVLGRQSVDRS